MPDSSEDEDEEPAEVVSSSRSAARAKDPRLTRSSPQTLKGAIVEWVCLVG